MKKLKELKFPKLERKELKTINAGNNNDYWHLWGEGPCDRFSASDWCQGDRPT